MAGVAGAALIEHEQLGGRGLALIQAFMTNVEYNECGNTLTMEKTRSSDDKDSGPGS